MSAVAVQRQTEFTFGPKDHEAVAELIYAEAGIVLSPAKSQLVYGRLARRLRACNLSDFGEYLRLVDTDDAERRAMVDALTTNHTSFFRESHHFDHVRTDLWPGLSRKLDKGERVRLWSAACSSGEEPYTLLMTILGNETAAAGRLARQDFRLLATDLSPSVIAAARAGRYAPDTADSIPSSTRNAWTRRVGNEVEIAPAMRQLASFRELNLLKPWPMRGRFDAIFCRNVMIYFDEPTKAQLLNRFADVLVPDGIIYIGHSERIPGPAAGRFQCIGRTIYKKVGA
ncbi:chemotaxis protein methyltransferase CheR [Sphingomonas gellani]|uniref:Chemotaxis protein methyltransferase n=1 Tax=Sphingomonas gellani TaxID=1166340 RepID=A0A1H8DR12_9SPHN|nr:protein-glutamate O-methyltransferase [Sphingomonas gellani]SEN09636.1 chemotaxis protein methyltransferase CheR [Sphingomonas gellani]